MRNPRKDKNEGVAGMWQVSLGPVRPVAGKSADKAWTDNIVSFITREWHILQVFGEFSTTHSTQIQSYREYETSQT